MPIKFYYDMQVTAKPFFCRTYKTDVVKQSLKSQLAKLDGYTMQSYACKIPCLSYINYDFYYPICWFRAFMLGITLPRNIRQEDFLVPSVNINESIDTIINTVMDLKPINNDYLKKVIEKLIYYILTYSGSNNTYYFRDDIMVCLLRLLHKYKPEVFTNPGYCYDYMYHYPKNLLIELDVFNKEHFELIDLRYDKDNSVLPTPAFTKKHVWMMYKRNQKLQREVPGYFISSIFMSNYNIFKLVKALDHHAISIYACEDGWYSNEGTHEKEGASTGKVIDSSGEGDLPQNTFHSQYNMKFNVDKGYRIVHYIQQTGVAQTTSKEVQVEKQPRVVEFYTISQLLYNLTRVSNSYTLKIKDSIQIDYQFTYTDNGYKAKLSRIEQNNEKYRRAISLERQPNGYFLFTENNEEIRTNCTLQLVHREALAMFTACNWVLSGISSTELYKKGTDVEIISIDSLYDIDIKSKDNRKQSGGTQANSKCSIRYDGKVYIVHKNKEGDKYIIKKKERVFLKLIRGKYRYV